MSQPIEICVIIKGDERNFKQKFLSYDPLQMSEDDPNISRFIEEAKKNFVGEPEDIIIKTSMTL